MKNLFHQLCWSAASAGPVALALAVHPGFIGLVWVMVVIYFLMAALSALGLVFSFEEVKAKVLAKESKLSLSLLTKLTNAGLVVWCAVEGYVLLSAALFVLWLWSVFLSVIFICVRKQAKAEAEAAVYGP